MSNQFVGEIRVFGFGFAPRGWALCQGQLIAINTNQALFALLGTMYGGNGVQNFALPDLRGRSPVHRGNEIVQGEMTGTESVTLLTTQLPQHNHLMNATTVAGTRRPAISGIFAADTTTPSSFYAAPGTGMTTLNPQAIQSNGGGQPHDNMQPFLTLNFCIALQGIFPSRN